MSPRRPLDHYETPPHYVEPLLEVVGSLTGKIVFEPCVGRGHISRYLGDAHYLLTNDINPDCRAVMHQDARSLNAWPIATTFDWTITNPPFSDELAILELALVCSRNVAFLARLSFLEPTRSRAAFWQEHPPTDVIVLPRYSFRVNDEGKRQTDNVTCCWLVYREGQPSCVRFVSPTAKEISHARQSHRVQEEDSDGDARTARGAADPDAARTEALPDPARRARADD